MPYYKLIIDPANFMRTIHNAFNVSFLFRDGAIVIEEDEFGYPTVRPIQEQDKGGNFPERNHQMVANLTTVLCDVSLLLFSRNWSFCSNELFPLFFLLQEMIQRYDIKEAMITWSDLDE